MKNYYLYLDDERKCPDPDGIVVRSVEDAKKVILEKGIPERMSLDHDLGDGLPTGYDFLFWFVKYFLVELKLDKKDHPMILIHTQNPVGKDKMMKLRHDAFWLGQIPTSREDFENVIERPI